MNATKKLGAQPEAVLELVRIYQVWRPLEDEAQVTCLDKLILAAAERMGCTPLLSEVSSGLRHFHTQANKCYEAFLD